MILHPIYIELPILVIGFFSLVEGSATDGLPKSKRQIYREQVLPSRGGKIPDGAFSTDRLALNRLNKEGISIPDGVLLEHRHVHVHPHINQHDPEDEDSIIKIIRHEGGRFVAPPGRYYNDKPFTVSSTYIIRKPIGPENSALRSPLQQNSLSGIIHPFTNQIFDSVPKTYYPQHYVLPVELTAPPQNFIRPSLLSQNYLTTANPSDKYVPVEVPSNKYLPQQVPAQKFQTSGLYHSRPYLSGGSSTIIRHPHPQGYDPPISYQSVSYFPILKPLKLPNAEALKSDFYLQSKSSRNSIVITDESSKATPSGNAKWPGIFHEYTFSKPNSFADSTSHSQHLNVEVQSSVSHVNHDAMGGRYVRKSKEPAMTTVPPDSKNPEKEGRDDKSKCANVSENAVDDGSSPCYR